MMNIIDYTTLKDRVSRHLDGAERLDADGDVSTTLRHLKLAEARIAEAIDSLTKEQINIDLGTEQWP